jgi:hypothetical protein
VGFASAPRTVAGRNDVLDVTWDANATDPLGSDGLPFTADDVVTSYRIFSIREPGLAQQWTTYVGAGSDGAWFTDDDTPSGYDLVLTNTDPDGDWATRHLTFIGAGADGTWLTVDDELLEYTETGRPNSAGDTAEVRVVGPGPDAAWLTHDDERYALGTLYNDQRNRQIAIGPDGILGTADDVLCSDSSLTFSATGSLVGAESFSYLSQEVPCLGSVAGVLSGRVFTGALRTTFDGTSSPSRSVIYDHPGADSAWNTPDDRVAAYYDYLSTCREFCTTTYREYQDAGQDGRWFTGDDTQSLLAVSSLQQDDERQVVYSGPGVDGEWGTLDDVVVSADRHLNALFGGNEVTHITYSGFGFDRALGTSDDEVEQYTVSRSAQVTLGDVTYTQSESFTYTGPGADGVWLTLDDELEYYQVQYTQ